MAEILDFPAVAHARAVRGIQIWVGVTDQFFVCVCQPVAVRVIGQTENEKFVRAGKAGHGEIGLPRRATQNPLPGTGREIGGGKQVIDAVGDIPRRIDHQIGRHARSGVRCSHHLKP